MSASTVHVTNISANTSEKEVQNFFSFCGKIKNIEITKEGETQSATVTFEKETAAKTALLLDNTTLDKLEVKVASAAASTTDDDEKHYQTQGERDSDEITQEEKPRSRIIAEYLAHGYVIGDQATQRAIDLDQKHGVSNRFLATLQSLDAKYHATDKAKSVDQSYGVSQKTNSLLSGLTSYYEKAAVTPTGQKFVNFYTQTSRQVQDIHAEARRLADIKKQEAAGHAGQSCKCSSDLKSCTCRGTCVCNTQPQKADHKAVGVSNGTTTCQCRGNAAKLCSCDIGNCTCNLYPKDGLKLSDTDKTVCHCAETTSAEYTRVAGLCTCKSNLNAKLELALDSKQCGCAENEDTCNCEERKCACNASTHEVASEGTEVVDSSKIAPLEPEKASYA